MAKKKSLTPLWTDSEVERWFNYHIDKAEEAFFKLLQRAGEEFVKYARKHGNYQDHTGNLRSSIGYIIVKNGKVLSENYEMSKKGTDRHTGLRESRRLTKELTESYPNGWVLIGVAGMRYAACVEGLENYDVITNSAQHTEDWLKKMSKLLFEQLTKKGY